MRYTIHSLQGGLECLETRKPRTWDELLTLIRSAVYQIQPCGQKNRIGEPIFSPSMNNDLIGRGLKVEGWASNVALSNPNYASGKDVDYHKDGVVVEVQFAHYGLLQGDFARMERLHTGELSLRDGLVVECGVEIVVNRHMPCSQSVARADQALVRGAPLAPTIPLVVIDVLPPEDEDIVEFHEDVVPRARRRGRVQRVAWGDLKRARR